MREYWLWFATLQGLSLRQKRKLLQVFSSPEDIYSLPDEEIFKVLTKEKVTLNRDFTEAEKILRACISKGVDILPFSDKQYPARLKEISDAPIVLYYKGNLPDFEESPLISVVGTRKSTPYGNNCARKLSEEITACGGIVVSGGAEGVDTHALQGALNAGGTPIAVLGCGVDIAYPPSNRRLFGQISRSGCLISEYPPGTKPNFWQFPARNRIVSGIANGVVVIEAPEKSGALITAQMALDQGRDVYVVPGNIDVLTCVGSNRLLQQGACPVVRGWDVVSNYADACKNVTENLPQEKKNLPEKEKPTKKVIDNSPSKPYHFLNDGASDLSNEDSRLLSYLTREPKAVDEVIAQMGLPAPTVLGMLTNLSLRGIVINHSGRRVSVK